MLRFLNRLWRDESGISSVEYALLLSFIAAGIVLAAIALSEAVSNEMSSAAQCIAATAQTAGSAGGPCVF